MDCIGNKIILQTKVSDESITNNYVTFVVDSIGFMFTKAEWDKSFIFNNIRLRREWLPNSQSRIRFSFGPLIIYAFYAFRNAASFELSC